MKAVRIHAHGGPEQLIYEDVPVPGVSPNSVRIRVKACALNHLDIWVREGLPGVKTPLPLIPGSDISGVVDEVGPGVTTFKAGDEVIVSPGTSCGTCRECLSGKDHLCRHYGILGETENGGYCEYMTIPVQNLLPKPTRLSFEEAAAFPLVFLTAWHMLVTLSDIRPGQWILIHAAGSGIGSAAVQIGKMFGCEMIATASSEEKLEKAKVLGAQHLLLSTEDNLGKRVRDLTGKRGVDVVFEHVGKVTFQDSYMSLCKGGTLVTCGATTGFQVPLDLRYVFSRQLKILGSTMGSRGELAEIVRHVERGTLHAVVDRTFPLSEARHAQEFLDKRKQFGKVVVLP